MLIFAHSLDSCLSGCGSRRRFAAVDLEANDLTVGIMALVAQQERERSRDQGSAGGREGARPARLSELGSGAAAAGEGGAPLRSIATRIAISGPDTGLGTIGEQLILPSAVRDERPMISAQDLRCLSAACRRYVRLQSGGCRSANPEHGARPRLPPWILVR